jgi:hypothetical protein
MLVILGSGHNVIAGDEFLLQFGYGFGPNDLGIRTLASGQNLHVASFLPATQRLSSNQ